MGNSPVLEVEDLTVKYETGAGTVTAASNVSFTIDPGEFFGLVGESGCGKSTIAQALIGGLDSNGRIDSGTVRYDGREIQNFSESEYNDEIRWKEISWIPQSSLNSLDPLERISDQALEVAHVHTDLSDEEALEKFEKMFDVVGLSRERVTDYPHQFSGGMQQRAIIALALFLEPTLVIADEPTTALDVIMQDQIFKYLDRIHDDQETSMMLITHDISVIFESADSMGIMHSGQMAEVGSVTDLYDNPRHPYSILLQRAFPDVRHPNRTLETIDGHPPQMGEEVTECTFVDRCPWAIPDCEAGEPPLEPIEDGSEARIEEESLEHRAACIRKHEMDDLSTGTSKDTAPPEEST